MSLKIILQKFPPATFTQKVNFLSSASFFTAFSSQVTTYVTRKPKNILFFYQMCAFEK
jgi:hypothetical protein